MTTKIVIGDDVSLPVTLKKDGDTFAIDSSATVKAALIDSTHQNLLSSVVTVLEATSGSDWANSLIVVLFNSTVTAALKPMDSVLLEIEVDDSGKTTWFVYGIAIMKGLVT